MAWGDIRFDHSDIFSPKPEVFDHPKRRRTKKVRIFKKARTKHEERSDKLLALIEASCGDAGITIERITELGGFKYPGSCNRAVGRLLKKGRVVRQMAPSTGWGVKPPFLYKAVKK